MKILVGLMIVCTILSCVGSRCVIADKEFVRSFNAQVGVIKSVEVGKQKVYPDDYRLAIIYLGRVTGIYSQADYSSTMGYRNKQDYKDDMRQWKEWLSKNKCWYISAMADSVLKR